MPEITALSGLQGQVRKYKPGDWHELFGDRRMLREPVSAWEIMLAKRVWLETLDCGPYAFDGTPPWDGVILVGDRLDVLLQLRVLQTDRKHEVENIGCESISCLNRFAVEINPAVDLRRNVLSEEIRDYFLQAYGDKMSDGSDVRLDICPEATVHAVTSGQWRIVSTLPVSGMPVEWSLTTGAIQKRMRSYLENHGASNQVNAAAKLTKLGDQPVSRFFKFICNDMDEEDFDFLWAEMDRHEPGIDTEVEVECDSCGTTFMQETGIANFIFPLSRRRRQKRLRTGTPATP